MQSHKFKNGILGLALLAATAGTAQAAVVTYTDRAAWNAATLNESTIDFESIAPTNGYTFYGAGGTTIHGVNFSGKSNILFVVDSGYDSLYQWGSGAVMLGNANDTITAKLSGANAVGLDLMSIVSFGATMTIGLSTGDSFTVATAGQPDRTFFGVTSDANISSISITSSGGAFPMIDNFSFGNTSTVPEPSSILLVGLAAAAVGATRRRKNG